MADHNPLACIDWMHGEGMDAPDIAICDHDGCPWESDATTVTAQTEAFLAHHNHRHQD